jgi:hypothetical protein
MEKDLDKMVEEEKREQTSVGKVIALISNTVSKSLFRKFTVWHNQLDNEHPDLSYGHRIWLAIGKLKVELKGDTDKQMLTIRDNMNKLSAAPGWVATRTLLSNYSECVTQLWSIEDQQAGGRTTVDRTIIATWLKVMNMNNSPERQIMISQLNVMQDVRTNITWEQVYNKMKATIDANAVEQEVDSSLVGDAAQSLVYHTTNKPQNNNGRGAGHNDPRQRYMKVCYKFRNKGKCSKGNACEFLHRRADATNGDRPNKGRPADNPDDVRFSHGKRPRDGNTNNPRGGKVHQTTFDTGSVADEQHNDESLLTFLGQGQCALTEHNRE